MVALRQGEKNQPALDRICGRAGLGDSSATKRSRGLHFRSRGSARGLFWLFGAFFRPPNVSCAREGEMAPRFKRRPLLFGERIRSEEHTSELQSRRDLVCRLLLE